MSVLRGHLVSSSPPQRPMTSGFEDFYTRSYSLHYFLILIFQKEPVFPYFMLSAKQGHYLYHFYNIFGIGRVPWLGIEPGTSHTQSQHYTTRLSWRWSTNWRCLYILNLDCQYIQLYIDMIFKIKSTCRDKDRQINRKITVVFICCKFFNLWTFVQDSYYSLIYCTRKGFTWKCREHIYQLQHSKLKQ